MDQDCFYEKKKNVRDVGWLSVDTLLLQLKLIFLTYGF